MKYKITTFFTTENTEVHRAIDSCIIEITPCTPVTTVVQISV